jgi:hypothetical protein
MSDRSALRLHSTVTLPIYPDKADALLSAFSVSNSDDFDQRGVLMQRIR